MMPKTFLAVAAVLGAQSLAIATAQPLPPPTTHDAAACAGAVDRSICYLQLYSRWVITPLRNDPQFSARPALLQVIEGPSGENVRARQAPSAYTRASLDPADRMNQALLVALKLDAEGAAPDDAIAPILAAAGNLQSRSFAMGQITTESGEELRIRSYQDILVRYRGPGSIDKRAKPSKAFVLRALAAWENDVSRDFESSQHFSLEYNRRDLAEAYVQLGDMRGAERVLKLAGDSAEDIAFTLALKAGDYPLALQLTRDELIANPGAVGRISHNRLLSMLMATRALPEPSHAEAVGRLALELEQSHSLPPGLIATLGYGFPESLRHDLVATLEGTLSRAPQGDPSLNDYHRRTATSLLVDLDLKRGDTARPDQLIAATAERVAACSSGPPDRCPVAELVSLLIKRGRVLDARSLLVGPGADSYLNVMPFRPFALEVSEGIGVPQTLDWMIEVETERGAFAMAQLALAGCVEDRVKPMSVIFRERKQDYDAALVCAKRAVALARDRDGIAITEAWNEKFADSAGPQGRAATATMAIEFASRALKDRPDIAAHMEQVAVELWLEAPPYRLESEALFALKQMAIARLQADGRF